MESFNSARRELLKRGGLGLAAVAATAVPTSYASAQASSPSPNIFDIRTFGAVGDGKTIDTPAINKAIEAAAAAGGGRVLFPADTWLCFSIHLKSHVDLYLSQGATILAADSPLPGQSTGYNGGTYDAAEPNNPWESFQDYGHNHWHNSLLWGENINDLSITGPGLIYGKGLSFGAERAARGAYPIYKAEQSGVGNKAIALKNCRNVIFRDFSILKGGHFGLLLTGVDNLTIDNLKIDTDRDGMDIDCCRNVRVSNCTVNSPWDDAICPKSSYALGYARATENVTISNCYVTGAYELGTLLDGTFKLFAPDAHVPRTGRIKCGTESNGGFKNITMRNIRTAPLFFRLGSRLRGPKDTTKVGTLRRILVNNIVSHNAESRLCSIISGIPNFAIEDVKLSNIYQQHKGGSSADSLSIRPPENEDKYPDPGMFGPMPSQGFFLRHIKNLELSHVEIASIAPDPRPSFFLEDVNRADFIAVTAPTNQPAFNLNKVTDLRILLSRAAPDTHLDTADGKTL